MQVWLRLAGGGGLSWLRSRAWKFRLTTSHPDLLISFLLDTCSSCVVYSFVFVLGRSGTTKYIRDGQYRVQHDAPPPSTTFLVIFLVIIIFLIITSIIIMVLPLHARERNRIREREQWRQQQQQQLDGRTGEVQDAEDIDVFAVFRSVVWEGVAAGYV